MALARTHELHRRRRGRNLGLGLVLAAFAALVFGLTIVKVENGGAAALKGFDHECDVALLPATESCR